MAIVTIQPSTPQLLVCRSKSYLTSRTISPVEDCDILSPIVDSIACIHENKENLELASFEERLVDAFCSGTFDEEVPAVIDDIVALVARLNLRQGGSNARDTRSNNDTESSFSDAVRLPLNDLSSLHNNLDDGHQVEPSEKKSSKKSQSRVKGAARKGSSLTGSQPAACAERRRGNGLSSCTGERSSSLVSGRRGRPCSAPASSFR